jgi:hypothetical protein
MLREQADQVTIRQAQRMLAQVRSTVRSLEQNVNARLALEVLMLSLPAVAIQ